MAPKCSKLCVGNEVLKTGKLKVWKLKHGVGCIKEPQHEAAWEWPTTTQLNNSARTTSRLTRTYIYILLLVICFTFTSQKATEPLWLKLHSQKAACKAVGTHVWDSCVCRLCLFGFVPIQAGIVRGWEPPWPLVRAPKYRSIHQLPLDSKTCDLKPFTGLRQRCSRCFQDRQVQRETCLHVIRQ